MADINVTITIPEEWISRVQAAKHGMAEKNISIDFKHTHIRYSYPAKNDETEVEFAQRICREHWRQQVKAYELSIDNERYSDEIEGISSMLKSSVANSKITFSPSAPIVVPFF